jgi:hypothetical protein|nr:hypothetical protein [uncultured Mediterranean phage uvMED]|tara:strand:- start:169 stop:282 length:114 start_codon:yes stop_codon:yes gene_type:complete
MSVRDILQMPVQEFNMWLAYFQLQNEKAEQQQRLNRR